ncbi:tenascin [Lampetra fluviatilis]
MHRPQVPVLALLALQLLLLAVDPGRARVLERSTHGPHRRLHRRALAAAPAGRVGKGLLRPHAAPLAASGGERQVSVQLPADSVTSSGPSPVVFNHVYNINVPLGSMCSVDLQAARGAAGAAAAASITPGHSHVERTGDGENSVVFTHRINIPPQACGCGGAGGGGALPNLQDLLSRLEAMENEVSSLRQLCSGASGGCCNGGQGNAASAGRTDYLPACGGHGSFSLETCGCICEPGWSGKNCTEPTCSPPCVHGRCLDGACLCDEGYSGPDCRVLKCPNDCNDYGRCVDGKCVCDDDYTGDDCSEQRCPNECSDRGNCVDGVCVCDEGFTGEDCGETRCPNDCQDRGRCVNGQCVCDEGFTGDDCSELTCPDDCKDRGRCVDGKCICDEGFTGEDCGELTCPNNCQDKGRCVNGKCVCDEGFTGEDCSELTCPNNCQDRGRCVNGKCVCDEGFTGEDCSELTCPNNCQDRGRCVNGKCICDEGFTGEDCSELTCPNNCQDKGRCVNGKCVCDEGFTGEDCSELTCPNNCQDRGRCVNGKCVCDEGFTGEDCSELRCPNDCQDQGRCVDGKCICDEGFTGEDCSELRCPNDCNDRGRCVDGKCICDEGFTGEDCSELRCPNDCNDRGRCVDGKCICDEGFTGEDCSELRCPNDCQDQGRCVDGKCICDEGFTGEDCSELRCPNDCSDKGRCVDGKCICDEGFTGEDCSELRCPNDCSDKGRCVDGKCICDEGFTGEDCSELRCPNDCSDKGRCVDGKCVCDEGFTGEDCSELRCPNDCSDKGRCVDGKCVCDEGFTGEDCTEVASPKDLQVVDVTDRTIDLEWGMEGEMVVTHYLVEYVPTAPGGVLMEQRVPGDRRAATLEQLEPGVEYFIRVYAVLSGQRRVPISGQRSVPISARVATHLSTPEGLRFKSVRESSVEVQWDPFNFTVDGWELIFTEKLDDDDVTGRLPLGPVVTRLGPSETSHVQSGLRPGHGYHVTLVATKDDARSPPASADVTTLLDAPSGLQARDVDDSSAQLTWRAPLGRVDQLVLAYGRPGETPQEQRVPAGATGHALRGLVPGERYAASILGVRGDERSGADTTEFTTGVDPPRGLQVVGARERWLELSWEHSRATADSYRVRYSSLDGAHSAETTVPRGTGARGAAKLTGLRPGLEYGIGVSAVKTLQESRPATINGKTRMDAPKNPRVTEATESSLTLAWEAPEAKAERYVVSYLAVGGPAGGPGGDGPGGRSGEVTVPGGQTQAELSGLQAGTEYRLAVRAVAGAARSEEATTTGETVLDPPRGLGFQDVTETTVVVTWLAPTGRPDAFKITYVPVEGGELEEVSVPGGVSAETLVSLLPGTEYEVSVTTVQGRRESEPISGTVTTVLDAPHSLAAVDVTDSTALLRWQATLGPVDSYIIVFAPEDGEDVMNELAGSLHEFGLSALRPITLYTVRLRAVKGAQQSRDAHTSFTTGLDPPRDLSATEIDTQGALVTWTPPVGAVTGYVLSYQGPDGVEQTVEVEGGASTARVSALLPKTRYAVRLYALRGAVRSLTVETDFTTVGRRHANPRDCAEALLDGERTSGVTTVYLSGDPARPLQVYCDMETDGGGWIVLQRRQNGKTSFMRGWKEYEKGFGELTDEFWFGLRDVHALTSQGRYELRVDLRSGAEAVFATYDSFSVGEPGGLYKIRVGQYAGTAGDSMTYHQGRPFSTHDRDNDIAITNCAVSYKGAWWYKNCHRANLNGRYGDNSHSQGVNWYHWKGHEHSVDFAEMKVRPHDFKLSLNRVQRSGGAQ